MRGYSIVLHLNTIPEMIRNIERPALVSLETNITICSYSSVMYRLRDKYTIMKIFIYTIVQVNTQKYVRRG